MMRNLAVIGAAILYVAATYFWETAIADHRTLEFYDRLSEESLTLPYQKVDHLWGSGTAIVIKHEQQANACKTTYLTGWHVVAFRYTNQHGKEVQEWQEGIKIAGARALPEKKAPAWDLALMSTTTPLCVGFPVFRHKADWPFPGHLAKIIIAGYPLGLGPYAADGRVMTWNDTNHPSLREPLLTVGAMGGGGMSGGPVFYEGYLIGMITGTAPTKVMGYLYWVIPSWLIDEFLEDKGELYG